MITTIKYHVRRFSKVKNLINVPLRTFGAVVTLPTSIYLWIVGGKGQGSSL